MFQSALVSTELTDGLQRLVHFVPDLAQAGIRKIIFLHVIPLPDDQNIPKVPPEEIEAVRQKLAAAETETSQGAEVHVEVLVGRASDVISQTVSKYRPEILLLGMQSRSLLTETVFGSTTMGLCQRSTVPLMILRPQLISTYTNGELSLRCRNLFRYLLIPYDGSDTAKQLVQQIKQRAQQAENDKYECLLLWIVEDVGRRALPREHLVEDAKKQLESVKAELESVGLTVHAEARLGNPVAEVLLAAQEYDITAIAGASGSIGKVLTARPSFMGEILRKSWFPVIYFPPARLLVRT